MGSFPSTGMSRNSCWRGGEDAAAVSDDELSEGRASRSERWRIQSGAVTGGILPEGSRADHARVA